MNSFHATSLATPLGLLSLAVRDDGAVVATAFGNLERLRERLPAGAEVVANLQPSHEACVQLSEYAAGLREHFTLRLAPLGTAFQHRVWEALQRIPRGQTRTYGELAKELKSSARAVGRANATNPLCVIVPCHRVVGAGGTLTGFAFGVETKRRLLELEGAETPHLALG